VESDSDLEEEFPPLADRGINEPHPDRLAVDHPRRAEILALHQAAIDSFQPGYLDPDTGNFVVTAQQLVIRRQCCGLGCRHCPYH
jgi:hypothetical protein